MLADDTSSRARAVEPAACATPDRSRSGTRPSRALRLERGTARLLKDGSAIEEVAVGGEDWLIGEILSFRGERFCAAEGAARRGSPIERASSRAGAGA